MSSTPLPPASLATVLALLMPAQEGGIPGAGELGVGAYVESRLGDAQPVVAAGLAAFEERARQEGCEDLASLDASRAAQLLQEVAAEHPGFLESMIFHAYSGYYQQSPVMESIGLEARPPFPGGYALEAGDLGLLDRVRSRPRFYREP